MSISTKKIDMEGFKLGLEYHQLALALSLKYITHPPDTVLKYIKKQFRTIEIIHNNTRNINNKYNIVYKN